MKNKTVVAYQSISKTIVVGKIDREGFFVGTKTDVEDTAIRAVSELLIAEDICVEFKYKGKSYCLKAEEVYG
ncbi:MAG: DUF7446 family protein [Cetobacterium sp.]